MGEFVNILSLLLGANGGSFVAIMKKLNRGSITTQVLLACAALGAIYLYAASILTAFGYNSYFDIPSGFISYSIRENTIFFYILFLSLKLFVSSVAWYIWVLLAVLIILSFFFKIIRIISYFLLILFLLIFLGSTIKLGENIAKDTKDFFVPATDCALVASTANYIIPNFYGGEAIFVPYSKNDDGQNKMLGGFVVKDLSEADCRIIYSNNIGKIIK